MTVADFYARKSSKDLGRSVARQEALFRADCASEGLTIGRLFVDPDFSASRYARRSRPDFEALIEHIRDKQCHLLSLWEVARGSRQMSEWSTLLDLGRDMGFLIRIIGEGGHDAQTYDPRRQRDRDFLFKQVLEAEAEVERTRSRTKAGAAVAAREGRPHGQIKDGYKRVYGDRTDESHTLTGSRRRMVEQVIDEPRAAIYREAAARLLADEPADRIASDLMARGIPTPRGRDRWHGSSIVKAVLSPTLAGHRTQNGKIVKEDAWPAILDKETADLLRRKFSAPASQWRSQDTRLKHFLAGAARCGVCDAPMGGRVNEYLLRRAKPTTDNQVYRYECSPDRGGCGGPSVPMIPTERLVNAMMVVRLRQPDALTLFEAPADNALLDEAENELKALKDRKAELYAEAARPAGPSMALVAATERQLLPQIDELEARVRSLRTPPLLREFDPADLAARWLEYSVGDRRTVVMGVAEVVVSPAGRGKRWSPARLERSRWRGDSRTWGDVWREAGVVPSVGG